MSRGLIAKDISDNLGYQNGSRDAMLRLDTDEKDDVGLTDAIGRKQFTNIINEYGLYNLMLASRKMKS